MGEALRRGAEGGRGGWRAAAELSARALLLLAFAGGEAAAQAGAFPAGTVQLDSARFTVVAFPRDLTLARSLLRQAAGNDTFPGLPRPLAHVVIAIAPDDRRFTAWSGPGAPEWGAAIAIPSAHMLVLHGSRAGSSAGDPRVNLRHELAHLALHEALGDLPPRWFDEGYATYAAGEWGRDEVLSTNLALVVRGVPSLDALDAEFTGGESRAQEAYALAHLAVADLASLDPQRGLSLFFTYWRATGSFDQAVRRAFGVTADGFEAGWKARTRRRYGALALLADLSLTIGLLFLVVGPLWLARRQRDRERLAAMRAADEVAERRDRESALAALMGGGDATLHEDAAGGEPANDDHIK